MTGTKKNPTHALLKTAIRNSAAKSDPAESTNMSPRDALIWYYSSHSPKHPSLGARVATAYPKTRPDPLAAASHLRSYRNRWFTTTTKTWQAIRASIFENLFTNATEYIYQRSKTTGKWLLSDDDKIASILLTCKQLRDEALPLYQELVTFDIGPCGPLVSPYFFINSSKLSDNVRNIQFRGWEVANGSNMTPAEMTAKLLERFPLLESLVIEAPEDGDHITISREGLEYSTEERDEQVAGFGGLLHSELVTAQLAEVDFEGIFEIGDGDEEARVREEFEAAVEVAREMKGEEMWEPLVRLALPVDLYSDLWLSWKAKEGESLRDLVVPGGEGEVEPHMRAMAVIDFEDREVEWRMNHHVVVVDMA